ncbi:MAG: 1,6-dihydroxycyclohexa-2,4-diene-1-carboxylate dehydrogenase [Azospirillum sp.]|nr:1,6-dihydroxycyclohexa-2,4-diene-1-carboxylate dehydrogenase [Azospirillum sp.]
MSDPRFQDKVMVVTGAAQGIGRRVAERAAVEGARLALVDRADPVRAVVADLRAEGCDAIALQADLETWEGAEAVMNGVQAHFGRLDVLVNNVGGTIWVKPYAHYRPEEIEAELRRSLFPTLWCCRAALPHLLKRPGSCIVNVSSVATRGVNRVPYAAAKGGVNALTVALAFEYADAGIRVNATAPGGTEAPPRLTPRNAAAPTEQETLWYQEIVDQTKATSLMHRYGTLDEQAAAILFLASDEASYITGTVLPVAGGDLG